MLVHYADLLDDLGGQMGRLAQILDIDVPAQRGPVLRDNAAFFRRGSSGAAAEILDAQALGRYHQRARSLAPPDLPAWLHHWRHRTCRVEVIPGRCQQRCAWR